MVLRFLSLAFGSRQRPVRDASCCLATASSVRDRKLFLSQGVPGISKPGAEENVPGSALPHDAFCGEVTMTSTHRRADHICGRLRCRGLETTVAGGLAFQGKNGSRPNN